METELTRSTKLVRNLLDFARQTPPALRETDINEVLERALDLIVNSTKMQHIEIVKEYAPAPAQFPADPDQLLQVFINLILNAIQAMTDGGTLLLRTWWIMIKSGLISRIPAAVFLRRI